MKIIDAHQHFWDPAAVSYPWLTPDAGAIYGCFDEAVLAQELAGTDVVATVLVQSGNSDEDTRDMLQRTRRFAPVAGIVGWVPLDRPAEAARRLDEVYAQEPLFKGVRHLIHNEADPDWLVRPAVIDGLRVLAARGLPFDAVAIWPHHLHHVETVLDAVPNLRIVVDHLAKPDASRGIDPRWRDDLAVVASLPGVHAKLSGLNTPYDHPADWRWAPEDFTPFVDVAMELFGAERLMWGGDWPISVYNGGYRRWLDASLQATAHLDDVSRQSIFFDTARRFYGLDPDPTQA